MNRPSLYDCTQVQQMTANAADQIVTFCAECGKRLGTLTNCVYATVEVFRVRGGDKERVANSTAICLSCIKQVGDDITSKWYLGDI